uniref:Neurofascin n=1 Tax=Pygocentrus nattereri TaxID=42514 RepID=A0AAR2JKK7_PYGNA
MRTKIWQGFLATLTVLLPLWRDVSAVEIPPDVRQPPMITKQSVQDHIVEPTDPITVECEATGNPPPVFTWTRDGVYLNVARDPQVSMKRRSGTLEIFFWGRPEDYEGVYQCTATNEFGSAVSSHIRLRVSKARTWLKEYLEPVSVFIGLPLILPCNPPAGPPKPQTYWMNSSMVPIRQDRRVSMAENGDLYFSSIVAEDYLTNYVCTARFPNSNTIQQKPPLILQVLTARMAAQIAPKFMKPKGTASTQIAMLGEELVLECFASGVPAPSIKWTKDWEALSMQGMKLENFNKTLRIKKVSMEDGGEYICTATNRMGSLDHIITVRVKSAPFWVEKPESLVLSRDDSGQIVCRADGIPRPQIRWLVNGEPIEDAPKSPGRQVSGDTLIFRSVVPDSTAVFQCNASNQYGYILANTFLAVMDMRPRLLGFRDQLVKVTEGSQTHLHCPYFGSPKPDLRWSKGGLGALEGGRYRILANGTLEIRRSKLQDQGTYVCVASNVIGRDEMEVQLEVKEPTKILRAPHNVIVIKGSLAHFDCKIQTDPTLEVTVTWLKDKKFLILGRRMTKDEDSLSIADVYRRDEGIYTCRIKTEVEEISVSAKLTVMGNVNTDLLFSLLLSDRPDPPTDLEVSDPSERSVRLTWVPGLSNHSPVKEYLVQYTEDLLADYWLVPSGWKNLTGYPGQLNSVVLKLTPFVGYQFRIIAINAIGPSRPSKPSIYYETGGAVPDAIPRNIKGVGTGLFRNNMEISWEPLEYREWNGPKLRYMVWWRRQHSREEWKNYTTYWWCSHIIYETDTFTPYEIKVQAVNDFGLGPESPVVIGFSGEDLPSAPRSFRIMHRHYDTIYLDWEEPAEPNGLLTGYILKYQTLNVSVGERMQEEHIPPNTTYFSLRRFDRYTRYKFTLAAQTQIGVGEAVTEESPHFTTEGKNIYLHTLRQSLSSIETHLCYQVDIATQGWFIGLMCAIALLVLIMLTVFFIKRSRGGKYPVRDKRDFALEPVDEKDEGTFDYSRQGRSQGAIEHMQKMTNSDDSLMEYVEEDEIEFNEDGSFIGEYTGTKRDKDSSQYHESSEATSPVAIYSFA